jgi:hypothetical protein
MIKLDCSFNSLTSLNVSGLSALNYLDCSHNYLADESKVTGFTGTNMTFEPQRTPPADDDGGFPIMFVLIAIAAVIAVVAVVAYVFVLRPRMLKK